MNKKRVSAVIIITLLILIPSIISIETDDEPKTVTIQIPDAISSPAIKTVNIASIAPGEIVTLQIPIQIGIGLMKYMASASWGNQTVETEKNYILIGFLIFTL